MELVSSLCFLGVDVAPALGRPALVTRKNPAMAILGDLHIGSCTQTPAEARKLGVMAQDWHQHQPASSLPKPPLCPGHVNPAPTPPRRKHSSAFLSISLSPSSFFLSVLSPA